MSEYIIFVDKRTYLTGLDVDRPQQCKWVQCSADLY